jgi:hypothetical protein
VLREILDYHRKRLNDYQHVLYADGNIYSHEHRAEARVIVVEETARVLALQMAIAKLEGDYPIWRHVKRGSLYHEVGEVTIQTYSTIEDDDVLILYRDTESGKWFGRPPFEFGDGRFKAAELPPAT